MGYAVESKRNSAHLGKWDRELGSQKKKGNELFGICNWIKRYSEPSPTVPLISHSWLSDGLPRCHVVGVRCDARDSWLVTDQTSDWVILEAWGKPAREAGHNVSPEQEGCAPGQCPTVSISFFPWDLCHHLLPRPEIESARAFPSAQVVRRLPAPWLTNPQTVSYEPGAPWYCFILCKKSNFMS